MGCKSPILFDLRNYVAKHWTAHSECTTKYENKTGYNTDYIVPDYIDVVGDDLKEMRKQIEKRNIYIREKFWTD